MARGLFQTVTIAASIAVALAFRGVGEDVHLSTEVDVPPSAAAHAGLPEVPLPKNVQMPKMPEVFPVPTTSRCIVIMTCQYMVIFLALAVCRTYHEVSGKAKGKVETALRNAAQTLTYGPMLCVLFIACRMRVEFLSDGKDQPQMWVQNCMYGVTFATLASTIVVLLLPLLTGKPMPEKPADAGPCDMEQPEKDNKVCFYALSFIRYGIMLGLYGGLAGVIVGICTYMPPGATDLSKLPAPAPAVMCTMILAVLFFATQLVIAGCRSYTEFTGKETKTVQNVMNGAATTVEFGPMLAILFLAARMRALQHDGQPQEWAQKCMYACTGALTLTTILSIAVPLTLGGKVTKNPQTNEHTFEVEHPMLGYVLIGVRYLTMLGFYGGAVGVAVSIVLFEAPGGAENTLPVSATVQCVMNLAFQFFFVYFMINVMVTTSEVTGVALHQNQAFAALEASKATLFFAPMLSILFVTTRMYALLITDKKGAPQAWVQDGMYMSTWSLLISFLSCLATGCVMEKVEQDEDGNVTNKFSNKYVGIFMTVVRYMAIILLYGGIATVVYGLFVMTPETANGRGSLPFLTDALSSTPLGNPPPGPATAAAGHGF